MNLSEKLRTLASAATSAADALDGIKDPQMLTTTEKKITRDAATLVALAIADIVNASHRQSMN
jgi:hypothetical protein